MNLSDDKKKPLRAMALDQKRAMLLQNKKQGQYDSGSRSKTPDYYHKYIEQHLNCENIAQNKIQNCVESLRVALANNPLSWVEKFGSQGLRQILQVLEVGLKK